MKRTLPLTLSAMLVALGVVFFWLAGIIEMLDLTVAAIVAVFVFFVYRELPRGYAYMLYAATSLLSLLLLPAKTAPFIYAAFVGWYPIAKYHLDHLPRLFSWILKLVIFNIAIVFLLFASVALLGLPNEGIAVYAVTVAAGNLSFVLYDILLGRLLLLYAARLRARVNRFLHK